MLFSACQEKESLISPENHAEIQLTLNNDYPVIPFVKIVDGRLVFENKERFDKAIDILYQNQDKLDGFEKQFPGFVLARMAFDRINDDIDKGLTLDLSEAKDYAIIIEEDGESYIEEVVHCSLLSRVLNDNGIVEIGQSIFKFTHSETLEYNVLDLSNGPNILDVSPKKSHKNVRTTIEIENNKSSVYGTTDCYKNFDSRYRRIRGRIESTNNYLSGIKLGFSVTSYRRPCRGSLCVWYRRSVHELGLYAIGSWRSRARDLNDSYEWTFGGPHDFDVITWNNNQSKLEYFVVNLPYLGSSYEYQVWFDNWSSNHTLRVNSNSSLQECWLSN